MSANRGGKGESRRSKKEGGDLAALVKPVLATDHADHKRLKYVCKRDCMRVSCVLGRAVSKLGSFVRSPQNAAQIAGKFEGLFATLLQAPRDC